MVCGKTEYVIRTLIACVYQKKRQTYFKIILKLFRWIKRKAIAKAHIIFNLFDLVTNVVKKQNKRTREESIF